LFWRPGKGHTALNRADTFWKEKEEIWRKKKGEIKEEDESRWWEEEERLIN